MCWLCGQPNKDIKKLREELMDAKTAILNALAEEKAQVTAAIEDCKAQIQALKDQLAAGSVVTPEDLDVILTSVQNIYTPEPTEPPIV